jgi:deoxyribonuclease IV
MEEKKILVGAHMSIAGGVHNAVYEGHAIGATTIQIFTSNQRQWQGSKISDEEAELFKKGLQKTGISHVMSHSSYLINLGSPKKDVYQKSIQTFEKELERCHILDLSYLTFHPGSSITGDEEKCLDTIALGLLSLEKVIHEGSTKIALETTAGQGTNVGYRFEHLDYIIQKVGKKIPIGVCFDTCHVFAAGYDIRTFESFEKVLKEFDKKVGLKYLLAFHMNDSLHELGSRKDRHASLGQGKIGLECFRFLMTHPNTCYLPKYLETPMVEKWIEEIHLLFTFAKGKKD